MGSSRKTTLGSFRRAIARPTRWVMPFEKVREAVAGSVGKADELQRLSNSIVPARRRHVIQPAVKVEKLFSS